MNPTAQTRRQFIQASTTVAAASAAETSAQTVAASAVMPVIDTGASAHSAAAASQHMEVTETEAASIASESTGLPSEGHDARLAGIWEEPPTYSGDQQTAEQVAVMLDRAGQAIWQCPPDSRSAFVAAMGNVGHGMGLHRPGPSNLEFFNHLLYGDDIEHYSSEDYGK